MNNDGFGQVGAGQDDMRQGGDDLQHAKQLSPMRQALDTEIKRHKESRNMRLGHLKDHYNR